MPMFVTFWIKLFFENILEYIHTHSMSNMLMVFCKEFSFQVWKTIDACKGNEFSHLLDGGFHYRSDI